MPCKANENRKARRGNGRVIAWLFFLTVATVAFAQLPTATILGTVRDSTGAVVPSATVTVRNTATGLTRTGQSAADGTYRFVALPVGTYEVRAEQAGFRTEVRSSVTLTVGQEAVLNFALQVGAIEQTVEVTGEAPLVNTTSGALGGLVNEQQVSDLPLNGRNYLNLTLSQPGVIQHRPTRVNLSAPGMQFSANGAPMRFNYYMLDGAPMGTAWGTSANSVGGSSLGVEGIREWRVVTNSSSAEYGMRMGAQMTIVSKGGTNSFHGSLFEYLRNSALDARNFFDYKTETTTWRLPPFRRNQFGGSAGGPIKKDKLFYFATYEALRERLGQTNLINVIPADCRVLTNNRCAITSTNPAGNVATVIGPLLALYPTPTPNLPGNRYTFPSTQQTDEQFGQARGDYIFSTNDMVFVRYTGDGAEKNEPLDYPQFKRVGTSRVDFLTASETHTFSPVLLGTFRFSYTRNRINVDSPSGLSGPQYTLIPGQELGTVEIGGVTALTPDQNTPIVHSNGNYTWSGDLFYTKGRHSLKFGTLANHYRPQVVQGGTGIRGTISFADVAAFLNATTISYSGRTPGSFSTRNYHFSTWGFYLQDDFRVLSRVTLNLGLRYEFHTDYREADGRSSVLRDIRRDKEFTVGLPFVNPSLKNLSPRLGFAWDVRGDGRTSVRGGFGVLYDIADVGTQLSAVSNAEPPLSSQSSVVTPSTLTSLPLFFPDSARGRTVRTMDYHIRNPHMLHYNFTVERQLPFAMAFSLAYAGARGLNLLSNKQGNPFLHQVLPDGRFFWVGNEPRANPNWDAMQFHTGNINSAYNSMQFVVRKRLSQGLQFQSAYTWGKLMDERPGSVVQEGGGSSGRATSLLPNRLDRGPSDYTAAHNWQFNAIYRLPATPVQGFLGKVLNGWWMSGILSTQTGLPFTATLTADRSRSRGAGNWPDLKPGRKNDNIILGGPDRYFDPLAFSIPEIGTLGNLGRNILFAPGVANLDFSVVKDTALRFLGESGKLEFRTEVFNILNRANFARPDARVYAAARRDLLGPYEEPPLPTAGRITETDGTSRQIQFALKVIW